MQVSYGEGLATHTGSESCVVADDRGREALTGVRAGRVLSHETGQLRGADAVGKVGRPHPEPRYRERLWDPAWSETPCMHASTLLGNREIPGSPAGHGAAGRSGKSKDARR